jgi:predicted dehydrogenase
MVSVSAQLNHGVIAAHLVNWLSPFKVRTVEIIGEEGAFVADTLTADLTFHANGISSNQWDGISAFRGVQMGDVTRYAIPRPEPLRVEHEAFRDAILGKDANIVTMNDGLTTVAVAEAILESAVTGRVVSLNGK